MYIIYEVKAAVERRADNEGDNDDQQQLLGDVLGKEIEMNLYPYQSRMEMLLRSGRSIILQAPTGAGKTRAALFPFLEGWRNDPAAFPHQCIYVVPMRVLANQFEAEYHRIVADYSQRFGLMNEVRIQTGTRSEDRKFEADLIFTTLDQALSSFLTIPYSLSNRQTNVNAGAIIGSYLVFDEFHLFPVDEHGNGALATTLQILQMLKGITPFVLMTATFSKPMLSRLAELLDAEVVTLDEDEVAALPSQQNKRRVYQYCPKTLTSEAVIEDLIGKKRRRVIAICNTVDRAQQLAIDLKSDSRLTGARIELLHSRFYTSDRDEREERIRREFGEGRAAQSDLPIILVATQVVEVGLNITSDVLHTELAPAAALVQRAGRCARFPGESGDVRIYELPLNENGAREYAPYHDDGQQAICERTREALQSLLPAEGQALRYHQELDLVDAAHGSADEQLLETLRQQRHILNNKIIEALKTQRRNLASELIRDVDTRTVIIHPDPTETTVPNPYRFQGIGLRPGQIVRWYDAVWERAYELELDWIAKIAQPEESDEKAEDSEQRRRIKTSWSHVLRPTTDPKDRSAHKSDLWSVGYMIALHPALVQYSADLGLRLSPGTESAPMSNVLPSTRNREEFGPLRHESYSEHIAGLYQYYQRRQRGRTAAMRHRFEQRYGLQHDVLDRAIRLMFAVHDLGKLDTVWQLWAHRWQSRVAQIRKQPALAFTDDYMAAHTDFDAQNTEEVRAHNQTQPKRPKHAAESARAARDLIAAVSDGNEALRAALMSAIICHHSPQLRTDHGPFKPAAAAKGAFYEAMRVVELFDDQSLRASGARIDWKGFGSEEGLSEDIIRADHTSEILLYLFLVRILRMADQESQRHL